MSYQHPLLNQRVEIEVSGKAALIRGQLIDYGQDILVVYNGEQFVYIPLIHLQQLRGASSKEEAIEVPELPFEPYKEQVTYRKTLMNAKGIFSEIYISGNQTVHGYLTAIMNDFFVFYSPVYHTLIISLQHLKYLIPYRPGTTPYALTPEQFPLRPSALVLARTFEQQLAKLAGELVVIDLGENPDKTGLLKKVENRMIELATANGKAVFLHIDHVKAIHIP